MNSIKSLFAYLPEHPREELIENILQASNFRIERIISHGHCSPEGFWYDQGEHEWVILLKGSAVLSFEAYDEPITMSFGDYIHIEKHQKHRVEWTDPNQETIWLAVYYY